ncbi:MAG: TIGR01777 family oxidoreductase [Gemmatimonadota bacterium]
MIAVERSTFLPSPPDLVYRWHTRPGAFERLVPPWESVDLLEAHPGIANGTRARFTIRKGPFRFTWIAEHRDVEPGRQFRDVQIEGPFARWNHLHRFEPAGDGGTKMTDRIELAAPGGGLGQAVAGNSLQRTVEQTLAYRHATVAADLALHQRLGVGPQTIAITGATGFIGRALSPLLTTGGHRVVRLVRRDPKPGDVLWDPAADRLDPRSLEGVDAIVHLAGESIAGGRWTEEKKRRVIDSRSRGTSLLARTLAQMDRPPAVLVCASAIGFYGDRGEDEMAEGSPRGKGFLADVVSAWEESSAPARAAGVRTVSTRFGLVLSPRGGGLAPMLIPFRLGLGGRLGDGNQWVSWIGIDDVIGIVATALFDQRLEGPVNAVAPWPERNRDFTAKLGRVLHRPTVLAVPGVVLRAALGAFAQEGLLASTRVRPEALLTTGYRFRYPELEPALRHLLGQELSG